MKKSKYLFLLRNKLLWQHSTRDINSIIFDYNEYFNIGLSNGKSEADMVADLGTPSDVAIALEDERDIWAPIKLLFRLGLGVMLMVYTYIYLLNVYNEVDIIGVSTAFTVLTPIGIWLLVGGDLRYKQLEDLKTTRAMFQRLGMIIVALFVAASVSTIMILYTAKYILTMGKLPFGIANANARIYFAPLFHFTSLVGAVIIVQIVRYYRKTFHNTLPLLFLTVGTIYSIQSLINKFNFIDSAEGLLTNIQLWLCLVPLVSGIFLTGVSYKVLKTLDKKVK